jgi:hypothetical protein
MNEEGKMPPGQAQNRPKKPFYKRWWFITIAVFIVLMVIAGNSDKKKEREEQNSSQATQSANDSAKQDQSNDQAVNQAQGVVETKNVEVKQETPVEPMQIDVTSQIVKKVSGKYRYFFDIRNNDSKDFSGSVHITLYNEKQSSPLGEDTFDTTAPIAPKMGSSVNFDINTGTVSEHGEFGITKYKYEVKVDNKVVKSGEGKISDKLENLDL